MQNYYTSQQSHSGCTCTRIESMVFLRQMLCSPGCHQANKMYAFDAILLHLTKEENVSVAAWVNLEKTILRK